MNFFSLAFSMTVTMMTNTTDITTHSGIEWLTTRRTPTTAIFGTIQISSCVDFVSMVPPVIFPTRSLARGPLT